jgi:hypothetical protein
MIEIKMVIASLYKRFHFQLAPAQQLKFRDGLVLGFTELLMFVEPRGK